MMLIRCMPCTSLKKFYLMMEREVFFSHRCMNKDSGALTIGLRSTEISVNMLLNSMLLKILYPLYNNLIIILVVPVPVPVPRNLQSLIKIPRSLKGKLPNKRKQPSFKSLETSRRRRGGRQK